jgi:hypothetical protein
LATASQAFEVLQQPQRAAHLARENALVKPLVGELTWEVKTRDEGFG